MSKKLSLNWGLLSTYRSELMGIACILIMVFHYTDSYTTPEFGREFWRTVNFGNAGVEMFLLLSGIGLYYSFSKSQKIYPFYKKRAVRLLVPYILIAVPYYLVYDCVLTDGSFWGDITQIAFITKGHRTTWYIPAIALFYILYPLIYKLIFDLPQKKNRLTERGNTVLLCAFCAGGCLVLKRIFPSVYSNTEVALTRIVVFIVGCYIGKLVKEKKELSFDSVIISIVFIIFYCFAFTKNVSLPDFWKRMSYVPFSFALCIVFTAFLELIKKASPLLKIFKFFGERSIEIYLTHVMLNNIVITLLGKQYFDPYGLIEYTLFVVILSVIISTVLHLIIGKITSLKILS